MMQSFSQAFSIISQQKFLRKPLFESEHWHHFTHFPGFLKALLPYKTGARLTQHSAAFESQYEIVGMIISVANFLGEMTPLLGFKDGFLQGFLLTDNREEKA